jgi:hypothetical protein
MTHYELLGVTATADQAHIRRAFIVLSRRNHPDLGSNGERHQRTARMSQINTAYAVLRDPAKRAAYDLSLHSVKTSPAPDASSSASAPAPSAKAQKAAPGPTHSDFERQLHNGLGRFMRAATSTPLLRWVTLSSLTAAVAVIAGFGLALCVALIAALVISATHRGQPTPANDAWRGLRRAGVYVSSGAEAAMLWLGVRNSRWPLVVALLGIGLAALIVYVLTGALSGDFFSRQQYDAATTILQARPLVVIAAIVLSAASLLPAVGRVRSSLL